MSDENLSDHEKEHSSGDCSDPKPAQETNRNPQQYHPPSNGDAVRKSSVASYIGEIVLAGLCGTGVWIFGEHLVAHGHSKAGVVVNFLAFTIYFAAAPITAIRFWPKPFHVWGLFSAFCAIMGFIFAATSLPEPTPYPHFNFGIADPKTLKNEVDLTNDFLVFSHWGISVPPPPIGYLIMPVSSDSNIFLNFSIVNEGPTYFAKGVEVTVSVPKDFECEANPPWSFVSSLDTNMESWGIDNISLFKEAAVVLPPLVFRQIPLSSEGVGSNSDNFCIWARGQDAPAQGIQFRFWFVTNSVITKPFVVKANRANGTDVIPLMPENKK